jgi:hypothetical protein
VHSNITQLKFIPIYLKTTIIKRKQTNTDAMRTTTHCHAHCRTLPHTHCSTAAQHCVQLAVPLANAAHCCRMQCRTTRPCAPSQYSALSHTAACTAACRLPYTVALPHTAAHTATHTLLPLALQHTAALPHAAGLPRTAAHNCRAHCHTLPHCRTLSEGHTATHCHTLPLALPHAMMLHCCTLLRAVPYTTALSHTATLPHTAALLHTAACTAKRTLESNEIGWIQVDDSICIRFSLPDIHLRPNHIALKSIYTSKF